MPSTDAMTGPLNVDYSVDHELQERVLSALDFDRLDRTGIGVTVRHAIVTLRGRVANRQEVLLAERIAQSVPGVLGVANDVEVDPAGDAQPLDARIAEAAVSALGWYRAGNATVQVIVTDGFVTLTGVVADVQQRGAAERAVSGLRGVRGVSNALTIGASRLA